MRDVVVLGQLLRIEGLAGGWWTCYEDLHWLESSLLAELILDSLNVCSESTLTMPVEVNLFLIFAATRDEKTARFDPQIKHEWNAPVILKNVQRSLLRVCFLHVIWIGVVH